MIERLVNAQFAQLELAHVRMAFSDAIAEIGAPGVKKVLRLVELVARVAHARLLHGSEVIYYPPAGPNRVPMYRDLAFLLCCRWMFAHTVFHFHASGLSELATRLHGWERWLFRRAYGEPDCAIVLSELTAPDGQSLSARRNRIVPYGIPDDAARYRRRRAANAATATILYVGALRETKGLLILLEAARALIERGLVLQLQLVGAFISASFQERVMTFIAEHGLAPHVHFHGPLDGDAKWQAFADADLLCFPSFYEAEAFSVALLEAMSFGLPVVASDWRGAGAIVEPGVTGLLVPPKDAVALAGALARLIERPELRAELGRAARRRFENHFTLEHWLSAMEAALLSVREHV